MKVNPGYEINTYFDTDGKAKLFYFVSTGSYIQPAENSLSFWLSPGIEFKPASNVTLRFEPSYERNSENAQYAGYKPDPTATETYGGRYVFARLDTRASAGGFRVNWAFPPNRSLQIYAQPLVSIGEYEDYKSLARPRSYDFDPYAYDPNVDTDFESDFNYKSLRGNAIFRWEYRPGSALFLVWNHNRVNGDPTDERFDPGQSFSDLFETEADNIFLAKISYYFTL